ncbi:MAG: hypothetical protein ACI9NT_000441 [Bacteroidia bacterium]|jgi:hypothetical protein
MIWQVGADLFVAACIPLVTAWLYLSGRIEMRHVWLVVWGFMVGSTWEFAFYFLGDSVHAMHIEWPLPIITLHLSHTFWDAGLFIVGYWLCLKIFKTADCCTRFRWPELGIMLLWGAGQEFIVELIGNGVIWEYRVLDWNPVWLTIGEQGYTVLPQLIWVAAPVVYYLGVLRINRSKRIPSAAQETP